VLSKAPISLVDLRIAIPGAGNGGLYVVWNDDPRYPAVPPKRVYVTIDPLVSILVREGLPSSVQPARSAVNPNMI